LTHKDAETNVKLIFRMFTEAIKKGERIETRGFSSFVLREHKT